MKPSKWPPNDAIVTSCVRCGHAPTSSRPGVHFLSMLDHFRRGHTPPKDVPEQPLSICLAATPHWLSPEKGPRRATLGHHVVYRHGDREATRVRVT